MRRRLILAAGAAASLWPGTLRAQGKAMPLVGFHSVQSSAATAPFYEAFLAGLRDLGYAEGRTIRIEARYGDGSNDRAVAQAAELVAMNVDVIVTSAGAGVLAAHKATKTLPIVVASGPDLVSIGLAASLARPGGNVTGLRYLASQAFAKRLELLKEIDPSIGRVGVLLLRDNSFNASTVESLREPAAALQLALRPVEASGPADYGTAFAELADAKASGLVIHDNPTFIAADAKAIATLAVQHRFRSIGSLEHATNGGLMAFSVDFVDLFRRSAHFVDRIIKGARPGDLPIEQPTKFRFVVNAATARSLGVSVPRTLLTRADQVIE